MKRVSRVRLLFSVRLISSAVSTSIPLLTFSCHLLFGLVSCYDLHHMPSSSTASTVNASKLSTHAKNHNLMNFLFYCLLCYNMRLFRCFFFQRKYIAIVNKENFISIEYVERRFIANALVFIQLHPSSFVSDGNK